MTRRNDTAIGIAIAWARRSPWPGKIVCVREGDQRLVQLWSLGETQYGTAVRFWVDRGEPT